ncbi:MAG TPA: enoyl-CoA hydratase/isomerase family protein [Candidatus Lustribacter sp.]
MSDLISELRGTELHLTLNRPDTGNGATDEMAAELRCLLLGAEQRASLVVLKGSGSDFCIGRARGRPPLPSTEALDRRRSSEVIFDCYQSFRDCSVPIVGVIQGRALGFGCSMAALCDITIASDAATFQIPEMNHNILPTMVMSALVDRVGKKHVNYLVLTRATISALRAREMEIVSEVVPAAELDAAVEELLARLATTPRVALMGTKEYMQSAYDMPTRNAVDFAQNLHAVINSSSEIKKR